VHLNDDDLAYLKLPTNEGATEVAVEQRALMASFETQRRDESARRLMTAERRTAADRLAVTHQRVCHSAHRRNMAAAREAREAAEWCWRLRRGQLQRLLVVVGSRSRISSDIYSA
jgi:cytochrome c5